MDKLLTWIKTRASFIPDQTCIPGRRAILRAARARGAMRPELGMSSAVQCQRVLDTVAVLQTAFEVEMCTVETGMCDVAMCAQPASVDLESQTLLPPPAPARAEMRPLTSFLRFLRGD